MFILGIETSCDETAAAIVENGTKELASSLASSAEIHEQYGGVVPEVAARKQVEFIVPVIAECLKKSGLNKNQIDALAVTVGPGLIGSLVVGVEAAKALSIAWNKPLVPVNHLVGHIYGNFVSETFSQIVFPALVLIVSGGHTDLVLMRGHGDFEYIGGTLDDAAGEAFDKVARILNISKYLGGPALSKLASTWNGEKLPVKLPRPMIHEDNFDFSFSGLKTATKRLIESDATLSPAAVAREFENAIVDVLVTKTIKAAKVHNTKCILLAGGVAANATLRTQLTASGKQIGTPVFVPPIRLCTDNAIYIAAAAFFNPAHKSLEEIVANPSLGVMDSF
ncbi:MAG TPA: tRNA (adenosine(37)-N6)-threonylcarbamoyltransferase complex transferase subunit TsaD [Candidatus Saccharimonadales bacterium]|nr:tRNA (adenosine(37)-N6)-threonylcarbamoyltransferase complex transferase subunit TsaD [Candidatus Saccharimonadales bacterium]